MLFGFFWAVRLVGESIISHVTYPFFEWLYAPMLMRLSSLLGCGGFWHDVLVGRLVDGEIDFGQSFDC